MLLGSNSPNSGIRSGKEANIFRNSQSPYMTIGFGNLQGHLQTLPSFNWLTMTNTVLYKNSILYWTDVCTNFFPFWEQMFPVCHCFPALNWFLMPSFYFSRIVFSFFSFFAGFLVKASCKFKQVSFLCFVFLKSFQEPFWSVSDWADRLAPGHDPAGYPTRLQLSDYSCS